MTADPSAHVQRIIPDGCIDVMWTGTRLVVAGPDTNSAPLDPMPRARVVGVRFFPGIAPPARGVPASASWRAPWPRWRSRRRARRRTAPFSRIALEAGYADQPHLTRECKALTGCTPAVLAGSPVTSG